MNTLNNKVDLHLCFIHLPLRFIHVKYIFKAIFQICHPKLTIFAEAQIPQIGGNPTV